MTLKATVIGGSLGGLIAGLALRRAGIEVSIYERNATSLESRGAGLRVQPVMVRIFSEVLGIDLGEVSTSASRVRYIDRQDRTLHEIDTHVSYTSWSSLYALLRSRFGNDRYHLGHELQSFSQDAHGTTARFGNGYVANADLLVFADGINSTGRQWLAPKTRSVYSGYICWRGYVETDALSPRSRAALGDTMTIALLNPGHAHVYPIPGNAAHAGEPHDCFNYVLYRNLAPGPDFARTMTDRSGTLRLSSVPPGAVRPEIVDELRAYARAALPPSVAELVEQTPAPFIQTIADVHADTMAVGRACLIGDAASGGRPHLGAATAKATINAHALARALSNGSHDVAGALARWAPAQLRLSQRMLARNRELGNRLQQRADSRPSDTGIRPGIDDLVAEALVTD